MSCCTSCCSAWSIYIRRIFLKAIYFFCFIFFKIQSVCWILRQGRTYWANWTNRIYIWIWIFREFSNIFRRWNVYVFLIFFACAFYVLIFLIFLLLIFCLSYSLNISLNIIYFIYWGNCLFICNISK
jgi:hypothetical protein